MTRQDRLRAYARLAVRVGANVQEGQPVMVSGRLEHAELVRAVTEAAWEAGASWVDTNYVDQLVKREFIEHAPEQALSYTPKWMLQRYEQLVENDGAEIVLTGDANPQALAGLDPDRIGRARMLELAETMTKQVDERSIAWSSA